MKKSYLALLLCFLFLISCEKDDIKESVATAEHPNPPTVENVSSKNSNGLVYYSYVETVAIKSGSLSFDWHEINDLVAPDFSLEGTLYRSWIRNEDLHIIQDPSTKMEAILHPRTEYGRLAIYHHPYVTGTMGIQADRYRPKILWGIKSSYLYHNYDSAVDIMNRWWNSKYYNSSNPNTHASRQNFARTIAPRFFKENYYIKLIYRGPKVR